MKKRTTLTLTTLLSGVLVACGGGSDTGKPTTPAAQTPTVQTPAVQIDANQATAPNPMNPLSLKPFEGGVPLDPSQRWPALTDTDTPAAGALTSQAKSYTVRIYYSDPLPASSPYRDGGKFHATLLSNLLGQYQNVKTVLAPISQYTAGDAKQTIRSFYIGTVYDEKLPPAFLADVKAGAPITWMGYNLWQMGAGLKDLGLNFVGLRAAATPDEIAATFNKVNYKSYTYRKFPAPQEMNEVTADPAQTETLATTSNAAGRTIPYLVRHNNFYFVADNPFTYITTTDRYLVLADSLKAMLGDDQVGRCRKQAILRLEDISALNNPQGLTRALDVLDELNIPFAMTVIPRSFYGGKEYRWEDNGQQVLQLYRAVLLGGVISQHGYTHNYHDLRTPEGNSAEEWEFWDKQNNQPLALLTPKVAQTRMLTGRAILLGLGIRPTLWTTPHYEADVNLYGPMSAIYPTVLERRMYAADGVLGGQFFPYPVKDQYGTLVLPENLGNVQADYLPAAVLDAAEANKNLDCSYASVFVHPYLLLDSYNGPDKLTKESLKAMIQGIQAKGFTFVNPRKIELRTLR